MYNYEIDFRFKDMSEIGSDECLTKEITNPIPIEVISDPVQLFGADPKQRKSNTVQYQIDSEQH